MKISADFFLNHYLSTCVKGQLWKYFAARGEVWESDLPKHKCFLVFPLLNYGNLKIKF